MVHHGRQDAAFFYKPLVKGGAADQPIFDGEGAERVTIIRIERK